MSFANSECLPGLGAWFRPLSGRDPYNKKSVDDAIRRSEKNFAVLEDHFLINTYMVGERLTLADIFVASIAKRGFEFVFDKEWRDSHPCVTRWFDTIMNQPIFGSVAGEFEFIEKGLSNPPPKKVEEKPKEKAKEQSKKQEKKKDEDEDEEEDKPAPKPKHPLEALPRATFVLDDM